MFAQPRARSPPFLWDGRPVAGCCVDWHERFGDAYDHGETVPTIQRAGRVVGARVNRQVIQHHERLHVFFSPRVGGGIEQRLDALPVFMCDSSQTGPVKLSM